MALPLGLNSINLPTVVPVIHGTTPIPPPAESLVWEKVSAAPDQVSSLVFVGNDLYVTAMGAPDNGTRGVYVSHDFGTTWSSLSNGLPVSAVLGNLVVSADGTLTVSTQAGPDYSLQGNTWLPANVSVSYFSDRTLDRNGNLVQVSQTQTDQIMRSTDNARSYQVIGSVFRSGYGNAALYGITRAPDGSLYAATEHDGIHYSTDDGANWNWLGIFEVYPGQVYPFGNAHVIKFNASGQPVVGCGQGGIFVHIGAIAPRTYPAGVETAGTSDPTWAYATGYPSVYLGADNTVHDFMLLANGDMLAHGGRTYRSTDGGRSWALDDAGIPAGRLNTSYTGGSLSLLHHTMAEGPDGRIYVAIPAVGFGIYRTTLTAAAPTPTPTPIPTPTPTAIPTPTPVPTPTPTAFHLITLNGSETGPLLAINIGRSTVENSVSITTQQNFGSDKRTRLMIFALGISEIATDPDPSNSIFVNGVAVPNFAESVMIEARTADGMVLTLPVEFGGPQGSVPGLDQLNFMLVPELQGAGPVALTVLVNGLRSNSPTIVIR